MNVSKCRFCGAHLTSVVIDLGMSPPSNALVDPKRQSKPEKFFPLRVFVCGRCWLVQLEQFQTPAEIFSDDYVYYSSFSTSWLNHVDTFAAEAIARFALGPESLVVEVASNDGYLLKRFRERGIPVLGIEPARNVADAAIADGIPTDVEFLTEATGKKLAMRGDAGDLVVGNNVLAHVPHLNDFVAGLAALMKPDGVLTLEFPHVLRMIERSEFDTIYHEHFSYFSLASASTVLEAHGLYVVDVDELPTHGGSLRVYARRSRMAAALNVQRVLRAEREAGLTSLGGYAALQTKAEAVKSGLLEFLVRTKSEGLRVAGYGAPAKATTLLNFCGVGVDLLEYTVDRSPHKQGKLIPGVRIPIAAPERIFETKPDFVLILPWNLRDEIRAQMADISAWGGKFVVPTPSLEIL
ncbi:MAG TPA: class I SAM-dependent methyltransferase [Candidatus Eremiobacteraceae bacterium]|nr:class I SAM-dependent methyltransferase [Candidatus Eremiobacteraceae bacterium]